MSFVLGGLRRCTRGMLPSIMEDDGVWEAFEAAIIQIVISINECATVQAIAKVLY